ncbi:ABC transporter permease [Prosthecomicrobium pneumaticum]|uniref:ABC-type dipeptide/oligopeptide/nickel transport system permease subunit n=1 Tax=Prosthecomicrobium pneumaticum TaxID=81895 RepID=A0A7W9L284_9HYPH|nr:ABC transporter permease [Prosthecomicrobium pneumaticum]MBB5753350.1 ABC-type dipeptide/oligopeptide/nickel transport system permease subunit [Prosthecomicrobium pneumaticum]
MTLATATGRSRRIALPGLGPLTAAAFAIVAVALLVALAAPLLATHDPYAFTADLNQPPGEGHLLGTDDQGQDVYSRLLYGTGLSLAFGAGAALLALAIGALAALLALAAGRPAEWALFGFVDLIRALPGILFALACVVAFEPGIATVVIALGISFSPHFALITRATYLHQMAQPYTAAARVLGAGRLRIALVHVLPNIAGALITQFAIVLPRCIVSESVLSFLGLGVSPETPTWGRMIASATPYLEEAPHAVLAPILALSLVTFALAIVGNAVRRRSELPLSRDLP